MTHPRPRTPSEYVAAAPRALHHGRLAYLGAFTQHMSLYVMRDSRKALPRTLEKYRTSTATLRFPIGTRVPEAAVRQAIRERLEKLDVGMGYSSAACGSDILFLEEILEREVRRAT